MKRLFPGILAGIGLVACAASSAQAQQVTLRMTHAFPGRDGFFLKPVVEKFVQQNPDIRIELEGNATLDLAWTDIMSIAGWGNEWTNHNL